MAFTIVSVLAALAVAAVVTAESHTISFVNNCGYGTPTLIQGGQVISTGQPYTSSGAFSAGIAYLQTGQCLFNGENCGLLEMTLGNPTVPGSGASTDISLIPPHTFNVPVAFHYENGCDGQGATCETAGCSSAFYVPDDTQVQVACQTNNVNLVITFCGGGSGNSTTPASSSSEPASAPSPTSSKVAASSSAPVAVSSSSAAPVPLSSDGATASLPNTVAPSSAPVNVVSAAPSPSASSTTPDRGTCKTGSKRSANRVRRSPSANANVHRRHHAASH